MGAMLDRSSRYLTKEYQTLRQIRGAVMYPAFMFLMCMGVSVFLLTFVLPRFTAIYESKNAVLPGSTLLLMDVSRSLTQDWSWWLAGALGGCLVAAGWFHTRPGRRQLDWLKLNSPVLGGVFRKLYLSRATRTIGTMIDAGVSLLETIELVRGVTQNAYYDELWTSAINDIKRGDQALRAGDSLAHDVERRAMIHRRANDRQAHTDIYAFVKTEQFHGDMALIMIHGNHDVKFPVLCPVEERVGGKGTLDV